MKPSGDNSHWIGRSVGAVAVAAAAFVLLGFWDTWELSMPVRIGVAILLGILFLCFGGSIWRWIDEIDTWS